MYTLADPKWNLGFEEWIRQTLPNPGEVSVMEVCQGEQNRGFKVRLNFQQINRQGTIELHEQNEKTHTYLLKTRFVLPILKCPQIVFMVDPWGKYEADRCFFISQGQIVNTPMDPLLSTFHELMPRRMLAKPLLWQTSVSEMGWSVINELALRTFLRIYFIEPDLSIMELFAFVNFKPKKQQVDLKYGTNFLLLFEVYSRVWNFCKSNQASLYQLVEKYGY